MGQPKILIIDDEEAICDSCSQVLTQDNYQVQVSNDGKSGLQKIDDFRPDIVFVDLVMPGMRGMDIIPRIREKDPYIMPIVITGYATVESAVESMKSGAYDFLPKPFTPQQLRIITRRALDRRNAALEAERLRQEKEKMRQNFIAMVSHELRTPLVAVMQYIEVLRNGHAGIISGDQRKIIERMNTRLAELLQMIDHWLKLSRIEEIDVQGEFVEVDLPVLIKTVINESKDMATANKITIEFIGEDTRAKADGHPDMLKEVFSNLVTNGIKYNKEGGRVTVTLREQNGFWIIDVSDTGIGISESDIPRVGSEFFRVKRDGTAAGTGIGIAIVRKILDIHEGKLNIESVLNQGSKFSVLLPKSGKSKRSSVNE